MIDDFKPPIKTRSTEELLEIAGSPKKWNPDAVRLAKNELTNRKVETKEIEQAVKLANTKEELEILKKANESYKVSDFISLSPHNLFINWSEVFLLLFSWELKKDGYLLKAEQQKTFRIVLAVVIIIIFFLQYIIG